MLHIIMLLNLVVINLYTIVYAVEKIPTIIPKKITLACNSQGYPTINALRALVASHYIKESNSQKISVKEIQGGLYSEKLYVVISKQNGHKTPLFFFKISKNPQSTKRLIAIQDGPIGDKFRELRDTDEIDAKLKQNLPVIIWLENIIICQNENGSKKTIEVTPAAQGQLTQDILDGHDLHTIQKAAFAIGKSLSSFHQLFMNYNNSQDPHEWETICHGDFGVKNVLFNPVTQKVYFIDNEGMTTSSINQDVNAILTSFCMFTYLKKDYATRWPLYLQYCLAFLKGYIKSYPIEKQATLALFIEESLRHSVKEVLSRKFIADNNPASKYFNEPEFKKMIYNYLHIFNQN